MLTIDQLAGCFPETPSATLQTYLPGLNAAFAQCHINTPYRIRAFLAETGEESVGFTDVEENLNYSAQRLQQAFPKYFPTVALAKQYAKNPQAIANRVYANRMGNGDEASGDGWRYRGRGLIQITGYNNYAGLAHFLGKDISVIPDYCETPEGAVMCAAWFWSANNLNRFADAQDLVAITRAINGGLTGEGQRQAIYDRSAKYIY